MKKELSEEVRRCKEAIRFLAREIDKINKTSCKPNNTFDGAETTLRHN